MAKAPILQGAERRRVAADLADGYNAGATITALAAEFGRSYGSVHQLLVEAEVDFRPSITRLRRNGGRA
jgi:hypothetical protein